MLEQVRITQMQVVGRGAGRDRLKELSCPLVRKLQGKERDQSGPVGLFWAAEIGLGVVPDMGRGG